MKKLLVLVLLYLLSFSAYAAEDIFKVEKIKVNAEALTQDDAKTKAIADGEAKAFEAIQQRFLDYGYITAKHEIAPAKISAAVDEMQVNNESLTAKSYGATLNFSFKPASVSKLLGVTISGKKISANRFLIVPIIVGVNEYTLWNTPWAKLWQDMKKSNFIIPVGDLEDLKALKPDDLQANNFFGIDLLARRYKTPVIILAEAQYLSSQNSLRITLKRLEENGIKIYELNYDGGLGSGAGDLYQKAAADISAKLISNQFLGMKENVSEISYERDFQNKGTEAFNLTNIEVSVAVQDLTEWIRMRRRLLLSNMVNNVEVKSFNPGKAVVNIRFNGSVDDFASAIKAYGLNLTGVEPDYQIIDETRDNRSI